MSTVDGYLETKAFGWAIVQTMLLCYYATNGNIMYESPLFYTRFACRWHIVENAKIFWSCKEKPFKSLQELVLFTLLPQYDKKLSWKNFKLIRNTLSNKW